MSQFETFQIQEDDYLASSADISGELFRSTEGYVTINNKNINT